MPDHKEQICATCNYNNRCKGGLECCGWMSISCKYNGLTTVGDTCCKDCQTDLFAWAEKGQQMNGQGGWFANDNS